MNSYGAPFYLSNDPFAYIEQWLMHALITSSLQKWPCESLMALRVPLHRVCGRTSTVTGKGRG